MKARIYHPCENGLYWGEIWNERLKYWEQVTSGCITEWGCKKALKKYKDKCEGKGYFEFEL